MNRSVKKKFLKYVEILLLIGIFVGIGVHLWVAINQNFWGDELCSLFFSRSYLFKELLLGKPEPIHPFLYYWLIKVLFFFFPSVIFLRIIHFVFFLAILYVVYRIGLNLSLSRLSRILLLCLWSLSLYVLEFTFQLRMYGLGILLCLLSINYFYKYLVNKHLFFLLIVFVINFFGFFVAYGFIYMVFVETIILLVYCLLIKPRNFRSGIIFFVFQSLGFLFYLTFIYNTYFVEINDNYIAWVEVPSFSLFGLSFGAFFGFDQYISFFQKMTEIINIDYLFGNLIGLFMFVLVAIVIFLLCFDDVFKRKMLLKKNFSLFFFLTMFLSSMFVVMILWFYSFAFSKHFFHIRQLFPVLTCFMFVFWFFVDRILRRKFFFGLILLISFLSVNIFGTVRGYLLTSERFGAICTDCKKIRYQDVGLLPLHVLSGDFIFLFNYCGAVSYSDAIEKCSSLGVLIVDKYDDIVDKMSIGGDCFTVRLVSYWHENLLKDAKSNGYWCRRHEKYATSDLFYCCFGNEEI